MHSLARNHPLNDGDIRYDVDEAEAFVLALAAGELEVPEIAVWLGAHLVTGVAGHD